MPGADSFHCHARDFANPLIRYRRNWATYVADSAQRMTPRRIELPPGRNNPRGAPHCGSTLGPTGMEARHFELCQAVRMI